MYVSWQEIANNSMSHYVRGSRRYFAALTILCNKILYDALTNHATILNFDAIIAYADKRPIHIIEQELSIMRQGSLTTLDYYNEVNKQLTLLINKTIMTHGSNCSLTNELNNKNRQYALRVFITRLNPPFANILFSLPASDLHNALAKAQELEGNHVELILRYNLTEINSVDKIQEITRMFYDFLKEITTTIFSTEIINTYVRQSLNRWTTQITFHKMDNLKITLEDHNSVNGNNDHRN